MADDTKHTPETPAPASDNGGNTNGYTPPATQEELNAIIKERLDRERRKFADYDELKAAKARLDEIEDANRSEVEKAARRAEQAEQELAALRREKTLRDIADEFGIGKDDLAFIEADTEDAIRDKAERLAARLKAAQPGQGESREAPRVGVQLDMSRRRDTTEVHSRDERARAFFGV